MYKFKLFTAADAKEIYDWNNGKDADFLKQWAGQGFTYPITEKQIIEDAEKCFAVFMIYQEEYLVGTIAILRIDEKIGSGYLGHFLLNPEKTGKGHGTHIMQDFLMFCFGVLKLKELSLRVYSFNLPALKCYQNNGFTEIERSQMDNGWEVLLMTCTKEKKVNSTDTEIEICDESESDYYETEEVAQRAFWNLHEPGCSEHLLVANLRNDKSYIKKLSKIAKINGHVVGAIMYSKACVISSDGTKHDVLSFGPLCVEPKFQSLGIGGKLLKTTMEEAKNEGYEAIIIFGEPFYYPKFGFKTCDHFGITTPDGSNFNSFMGIELKPGALASIKGKFYEAEVMENLPKEKVEEKNRMFPQLLKMHLPDQWE